MRVSTLKKRQKVRGRRVNLVESQSNLELSEIIEELWGLYHKTQAHNENLGIMELSYELSVIIQRYE